MEIAVIIILTALLAKAVLKWVAYSTAYTGLLYHIAITFGEDAVPSEAKLKEIRDYAINRMVKDLFKKKARY